MNAEECCCDSNPPIDIECKCYGETRMPTEIRVDIEGVGQQGAVTGGCYGTGLCDNLNGSYVLTYVPGANDYGTTFPPCEDGDLTAYACVWALDMTDILLCDLANPDGGGGGHQKYKAVHMVLAFLPGTTTTVPVVLRVYVDRWNNKGSTVPYDFDGCGGPPGFPAESFGWGKTLTASPANSNRVDCDTLLPLVLDAPGTVNPFENDVVFTCITGTPNDSTATISAL